MAHFLQVRVAFEKFLAASCDTPEPLCKLFLFRAARGFVDLCSDVLGWVTGTSQSLVSFCPHPPGRSWLVGGEPFPTRIQSCSPPASQKCSVFLFQTQSQEMAHPPASTSHVLGLQACATACHHVPSRLAELCFLL